MNDGLKLSKEDLLELHWQERIPHLDDAHFTEDEFNQIQSHAAMDLLRASELRTLVILLANRLGRAEQLLRQLRDADIIDRGEPL